MAHIPKKASTRRRAIQWNGVMVGGEGKWGKNIQNPQHEGFNDPAAENKRVWSVESRAFHFDRVAWS